MVEVEEKVSYYLTFKIGEEEFAAHVNDVLNIVEVQEITKIPNAPDYISGIINFRGKVLPIIDARKKLGMISTEFTRQTCIIVLEVEHAGNSLNVGAIVDSVEAVYEIDESIIEAPPAIGSTYKSDFIKGIAMLNGNYVMLLDIVKLFDNTDIEEINKRTN